MSVKNWKDYLNEETSPVEVDSSVEQDLTQRSTDLESVRNQVTEITTAATALNAMNDAEAVASAVEQKISAFSNNKDSFVTLALSYLKTISDKKLIELKLVQYQESIPALQQEIKNKLDSLNSEIDGVRTTAEEPPVT